MILEGEGFWGLALALALALGIKVSYLNQFLKPCRRPLCKTISLYSGPMSSIRPSIWLASGPIPLSRASLNEANGRVVELGEDLGGR